MRGGANVEDSRIIELFNSRDEAAITETERKYGAYCRCVALNLLGVHEDADECVNDALHAAWNAIPPESPASLKAFLGRITRNISVSRWRRDHARKRFSGVDVLLSELNDCVPESVALDEVLERRRLSEVISAWLDTLSRADSALFVRRYWYGESVAALAREAGCTASQLTQRMLRLRRRLKAHLEAEGATT